MTIERLKRASLPAMFIMAVAGPAAAQTVTLSCKFTQSPGALTIRVDYATGVVQIVDGERANGTVTANVITWSGSRSFVATAVDNVTKREMTSVFNGRIDRLSGTGWIETGYWPATTNYPVTCNSVTVPKF